VTAKPVDLDVESVKVTAKPVDLDVEPVEVTAKTVSVVAKGVKVENLAVFDGNEWPGAGAGAGAESAQDISRGQAAGAAPGNAVPIPTRPGGAAETHPIIAAGVPPGRDAYGIRTGGGDRPGGLAPG